MAKKKIPLKSNPLADFIPGDQEQPEAKPKEPTADFIKEKPKKKK